MSFFWELVWVQSCFPSELCCLTPFCPLGLLPGTAQHSGSLHAFEELKAPWQTKNRVAILSHGSKNCSLEPVVVIPTCLSITLHLIDLGCGSRQVLSIISLKCLTPQRNPSGSSGEFSGHPPPLADGNDRKHILKTTVTVCSGGHGII